MTPMLPMLALLASLGTAPATDSIPGKWAINGDVGGTPVKTLCTIIRTGSTISGNCTNAGRRTVRPHRPGEGEDDRVSV